MERKTPVVLVVQVETARLRWFVSALGLDGGPTPLLRSAEGDLEKYRGLDFDEQVSFLRHRLCGVLQRGCDRLWGRNWKACQFAIVFEGLLPEPTGTLTQAVGDHFALWMLNPPAAVFNDPAGPGDPPRPGLLAGSIDAPLEELLRAHLGELTAGRADEGAWEAVPRKPGG
jgi:hypothetical protein